MSSIETSNQGDYMPIPGNEFTIFTGEENDLAEHMEQARDESATPEKQAAIVVSQERRPRDPQAALIFLQEDIIEVTDQLKNVEKERARWERMRQEMLTEEKILNDLVASRQGMSHTIEKVAS